MRRAEYHLSSLYRQVLFLALTRRLTEDSCSVWFVSPLVDHYSRLPIKHSRTIHMFLNGTFYSLGGNTSLGISTRTLRTLAASFCRVSREYAYLFPLRMFPALFFSYFFFLYNNCNLPDLIHVSHDPFLCSICIPSPIWEFLFKIVVDIIIFWFRRHVFQSTRSQSLLACRFQTPFTSVRTPHSCPLLLCPSESCVRQDDQLHPHHQPDAGGPQHHRHVLCHQPCCPRRTAT